MYRSSPAKRIDLILASLIGDRVDVILETVDYRTTLFSIAAGMSHLREGAVGVAVALRNPELVKIRDAIDKILTRDPGEPRPS